MLPNPSLDDHVNRVISGFTPLTDPDVIGGPFLKRRQALGPTIDHQVISGSRSVSGHHSGTTVVRVPDDPAREGSGLDAFRSKGSGATTRHFDTMIGGLVASSGSPRSSEGQSIDKDGQFEMVQVVWL